MSALAKITSGFAALHSEAKAGADRHLERYITGRKHSFFHAASFDKYAEEQQLLAHKSDAVQRLANGWRR